MLDTVHRINDVLAGGILLGLQWDRTMGIPYSKTKHEVNYIGILNHFAV